MRKEERPINVMIGLAFARRALRRRNCGRSIVVVIVDGNGIVRTMLLQYQAKVID